MHYDEEMKVDNLSWIRQFSIPLLAGTIFALGFPLYSGQSFAMATLLGLFVFFYLLEELFLHRKWGRAALTFFAFSVGVNLVAFSWIGYVLQEFGDFSPLQSKLIAALFALIIFPQYLFYILMRMLVQSNRYFHSFKIDQTSYPLLMAILLTFLDQATPSLFPIHPGLALLPLAPYLGAAPILGALAFSFFIYWSIFEILHSFKVKKISKLFITTLSLFILLNIIFKLTLPTQYRSTHLNIRLVQGNIGNYLKIDSEKGGETSFEVVKERYRSLSKLPSKNPLDLIIWPETSYPLLMDTTKPSAFVIPAIIRDVVTSTKADLLVGGYDAVLGADPHNYFEDQYNATFHFNLSSDNIKLSDTYQKIKLIPFGETLPFGPLNYTVGSWIKNISFFKAGEKYTIFKTKNALKFSTLICYESLFSSFTRRFFNGEEIPDFFINLANDSWYGKTSEPHQNSFLSHWRALEFGIPVVRSTNTGISNILYQDGSKSLQTGLFTQEILDLPLILSKDTKRTFYAKWGELPLTFLMMVLLILRRRLQMKTLFQKIMQSYKAKKVSLLINNGK